MNHCLDIADIEDYVLGHLPRARAEQLRGHLAQCAACQRAERFVIEERALFERRAEVAEPLPAQVTEQLRARLFAEAAATPAPARAGKIRFRFGAAVPAVMGAAVAALALFVVLRSGGGSSVAAAPESAPGAVTPRPDDLFAPNHSSWSAEPTTCEPLASEMPPSSDLACEVFLSSVEDKKLEIVTCESGRQ